MDKVITLYPCSTVHIVTPNQPDYNKFWGKTVEVICTIFTHKGQGPNSMDVVIATLVKLENWLGGTPFHES